MALLRLDEDVKNELHFEFDADNFDWDNMLKAMMAAVEKIWDELTRRIWESTAHTEYHSTDSFASSIFLDNFPVDSSAAFSLYEDADWDFAAADLIDTDDYIVDYPRGIVYYDGTFLSGKHNVKVIYTAGYTSATLPADVRQILVRQIAVWWKQAKDGTWHIGSRSSPAGGGTVSFTDLRNNLLPDFVLMSELHRRYMN